MSSDLLKNLIAPAVAAVAIVGGSALLLADGAQAADRTFVIRDRNVNADRLLVNFQSDGGCLVVVGGQAIPDGGDPIEKSTESQPWNGARCTTLKNSADTALRNSFGVGDGGAP